MALDHLMMSRRQALGLGAAALSALGLAACDTGEAPAPSGDSTSEQTEEAKLDAEAYDALLAEGAVACSGPDGAASEAGPVDLVILATKATGLDQALDTMERLVGPRTAIASLLNGITSEERVAERFGWGRTVLSVAQGMDAVFIGGEMTYTHPGEIRFGAAPGTDPGVVDDVADLYGRAGIPHVVEAGIRRRMWVKLMLNVGINQTCMAFGGTYGTASEPGSEQNRCFVAAMREALAVARAEGVDVTEADLVQMADLVAGLEPDGLPSMAEDRINRKPTEVEEFSGTVIRLAERHGILVPTNRWLYGRIHEIEAGF